MLQLDGLDVRGNNVFTAVNEMFAMHKARVVARTQLSDCTAFI